MGYLSQMVTTEAAILLSTIMDKKKILVNSIICYFQRNPILQKETHFLRSLFQLFQFEGYPYVYEMISYITKYEIDHTTDKARIFRTNSIATVLLHSLMEQVMGSYLFDVLGPLIRKVVLSKVDLEIDPLRM